jgi:Uma2 family endonuclease
MALPQSKPHLTSDQYLAIERNAEYKSEYFDGEMYALAGATKNHNLVAGNVLSELHAQVKGRPCNVFPSDMRVKVAATGLYTYPDVTVICGEARFEDQEEDTLLNPTVIVEVLSKSTANYDRGEKFAHYRRLPSLAEYVLIAQDKPHVEHYVRQPDNTWLLSESEGLQDTVELPAINCYLKLADVYDKVTIAVRRAT